MQCDAHCAPPPILLTPRRVQQLAELVGKNLYQLSSLSGLNYAQYEALVLPCIAEQIVQCEDKLAQQYLMEVRPFSGHSHAHLCV